MTKKDHQTPPVFDLPAEGLVTVDEDRLLEERPERKPKGIGTKSRRTVGLRIQLALAAHRLKTKQKNRDIANRAAGFETKQVKDPIVETNLYAPQLVTKITVDEAGNGTKTLVPFADAPKGYKKNRAARRHESRGMPQPGGHRYRTPVHAVKASASIWAAASDGTPAVSYGRTVVMSKLQRNAYERMLAKAAAAEAEGDH